MGPTPNSVAIPAALIYRRHPSNNPSGAKSAQAITKIYLAVSAIPLRYTRVLKATSFDEHINEKTCS
jgi:hypothetical protein